MQTIYVSPEFSLNRRMRKAVRRGKLEVVREDGESSELGGGNSMHESKVVTPINTPDAYIVGYKSAADILVSQPIDDIKRNALLFPIFYLYRQYMELEMKLLCDNLGGVMIRLDDARENEFNYSKKGHNLWELWKVAKKCVIKSSEILGEEVTYFSDVERKPQLNADFEGKSLREILFPALLDDSDKVEGQPVDLEKKGNEFDMIVEFFHEIDPGAQRGRFPKDTKGCSHELQEMDIADLKKKADKFSGLFKLAWYGYEMLSDWESERNSL